MRTEREVEEAGMALGEKALLEPALIGDLEELVTGIVRSMRTVGLATVAWRLQCALPRSTHFDLVEAVRRLQSRGVIQMAERGVCLHGRRITEPVLVWVGDHEPRTLD